MTGGDFAYKVGTKISQIYKLKAGTLTVRTKYV